MAITTYTTSTAAQAGLMNRASDAGYGAMIGLGHEAVQSAILANTTRRATLPSTVGAGISAGVGTVYKTSVAVVGDVIITRIFIDLTGLSSAAAGDIIGTAGVCHIGQITAAVNGTIMGGKLYCTEAPAGGEADIDLYAATEATGAYDAAITGLTETQAVNSGTLALTTAANLIADSIAADSYLYLVSVGAGAAAYTAGRIMIELWGV